MSNSKKEGIKFEHELISSFNKVPYTSVYKPPDTPGITNGKMSFTPKRPFDMFVCHRGISIAIEAKKTSCVTSFPFGNQAVLKPHQIGYLYTHYVSWGPSFVFVNFRNDEMCRAAAVPISFIIDNLKTLKYKYIFDTFQEIPRDHNLWNVEHFLNSCVKEVTCKWAEYGDA